MILHWKGVLSELKDGSLVCVVCEALFGMPWTHRGIVYNCVLHDLSSEKYNDNTDMFHLYQPNECD